jgi:hypothetical protein
MTTVCFSTVDRSIEKSQNSEDSRVKTEEGSELLMKNRDVPIKVARSPVSSETNRLKVRRPRTIERFRLTKTGCMQLTVLTLHRLHAAQLSVNY